MQQTTIAPLLTNASIAAERLVSVLRIAVTLGLLTVFVLTVAGLDFSTLAPFLHRQLLFAVLTMFAYLMLGVVTFAATTLGWFRPWMSWFSVTADCGFLLFNVWFSLENSSYPGGVALLLPGLAGAAGAGLWCDADGPAPAALYNGAAQWRVGRVDILAGWPV
ncbi:hypothetical protein ACM258_04265 [Phaeobacter piscinae]|uniref:hypothetical protein n=1 Tax=Phaeobacter piscinae TaxID=1580596 RepID=UPI0039F6ADA9